MPQRVAVVTKREQRNIPKSWFSGLDDDCGFSTSLLFLGSSSHEIVLLQPPERGKKETKKNRSKLACSASTLKEVRLEVKEGRKDGIGLAGIKKNLGYSRKKVPSHENDRLFKHQQPSFLLFFKKKR